MKIELETPDSIELPFDVLYLFKDFAQKMLNRIAVGQLRYGKPHKRKRYMTRMDIELKKYQEKGNAEQLFNIANYALLEHSAPEHEEHHHDPNVNSFTRGRLEFDK